MPVQFYCPIYSHFSFSSGHCPAKLLKCPFQITGSPYKGSPYIALLKHLALINSFQPYNRLMGKIIAVALNFSMRKPRHRGVGNLPMITQPETGRDDIQTQVIFLQNSCSQPSLHCLWPWALEGNAFKS